MKKLLLFFVTFMLMFTLAACGDDDDSGDTPTLLGITFTQDTSDVEELAFDTSNFFTAVSADDGLTYDVDAESAQWMVVQFRNYGQEISTVTVNSYEWHEFMCEHQADYASGTDCPSSERAVYQEQIGERLMFFIPITIDSETDTTNQYVMNTFSYKGMDDSKTHEVNCESQNQAKVYLYTHKQMPVFDFENDSYVDDGYLFLKIKNDDLAPIQIKLNGGNYVDLNLANGAVADENGYYLYSVMLTEQGANSVRFQLQFHNGVNQQFWTYEETKMLTDQIPPVFTYSDATIYVDYGGSWSLPTYSVTDDVDGDVTGDVVVTYFDSWGDGISAGINTSTPGNYTVRLSVYDAAGNWAYVEIPLVVNPQ